MWEPGQLWPMHMNILEASGIGGAKYMLVLMITQANFTINELQ